jgi:hypothetical protein
VCCMADYSEMLPNPRYKFGGHFIFQRLKVYSL